MKCEFCGSNIDIETDVCPYCGMKKSQFEEHRRAMGEYADAFRNTQENVVKKNQKFSANAASITVLCLLVIAILIVSICNVQNYAIYHHVTKARINRHAAAYTAKLDELEAAGDYEGFNHYFEANSLEYVSNGSDCPVADYILLYRLSSYYTYAIETISNLRTLDFTDNELNMEHQREYLVEYYQEFISCYNRVTNDRESLSFYSEGNFSQTHLDSMEAMLQNLNSFIVTYMGIDESEIEEFQNQTKAHQLIMLEEAMENEQK
jgi:hypothetical protein